MKPATKATAKAPAKTSIAKKPSTTANSKPPCEKFEPPTLGGNITPEMLVDELGEAKEQKAYWEKAEAFYKEAMKARADGAKSIIGEKFIATVAEQSRTTLNSDKVRKLLTAEEAADCEQTTTFDVVNVKRR